MVMTRVGGFSEGEQGVALKDEDSSRQDTRSLPRSLIRSPLRLLRVSHRRFERQS
jgi:hypothetical protein